MLGDISGLDRIYIVCGYTDMRKSIDGLCAIIEDQLKASLDSRSLFIKYQDKMYKKYDIRMYNYSFVCI